MRISDWSSDVCSSDLGKPLVQPDPALDYVENLLHISGALEHQHKLSRHLVKSIMNKLLILHADHEQNCSTSTVRMIGSADADLHASIAGGIHALSGPLHGGANQQVIEMRSEEHTSELQSLMSLSYAVFCLN